MPGTVHGSHDAHDSPNDPAHAEATVLRRKHYTVTMESRSSVIVLLRKAPELSSRPLTLAGDDTNNHGQAPIHI